MKHDGDALAAPASDPASIPALLKTPTTANLIRVFHLQERLKGLGKEGEFGAAHVHVVGAGHDGRRHRGVVRVARPQGHAAGPERGAARAGDAAGRQALRATGCAIRGACATRSTA